MKNKKNAFTLIELLVVIVIIGILSTISTATFSGYFAKARDAERGVVMSQMKDLFQALLIEKHNIEGDFVRALDFESILLENGYGSHRGAADICQYIFWEGDNNLQEKYILLTWNESEDEIFYDGSDIFVTSFEASGEIGNYNKSSFSCNFSGAALTMDALEEDLNDGSFGLLIGGPNGVERVY